MIPKRLAVALLAATARLCAADREETLLHETVINPAILNNTASDYEVSVASVSLNDASTDIPDIEALHNGRPFDVIAELHWEEQVYDTSSTNELFWETLVDGTIAAQGKVNLRDTRALPTSIAAGTAVVDNSGTHNVKVRIMLDALINENDRDYESFNAGASFVPLVIVIFFAATTQMVSICI